MKAVQKIVSILLTVTMIVSLFTIIPLEASAENSIEYIYRWWDADANSVQSETRTVLRSDCIRIQDIGSNRLDSDQGERWIVVDSNTTVNDRLYINDHTVNLILCDDVTLTLGLGISVGVTDNTTGKLNIYGQENDTGKIYSHIDKDNKDNGERAIIGGDVNQRNSGDIHIYGGTLDLKTSSSTWDYRGACIGGGENGSAREVCIYGGNFQLYDSAGACIGGGQGGEASYIDGNGIRIYGGTIVAEGYSGAAVGNGTKYSGTAKGGIAIYGGKITANGVAGSAGIGGGSGNLGEKGAKGSSNGPITIYGGTVAASSTGSKHTGAGIGSGEKTDQGSPIRILGGTVVAMSQSGAGIGAGACGSAGVIEISNANVTGSASAWGAGIGGGKEGNGGEITITNSTVTATSSNYGSAEDFLQAFDKATSKLGMKTNDQAYADAAVGVITLLIDLFDTDYSGAGIGGGHQGSGGTIKIINSTVEAKSGNYAAAIGGGENKGFDSITIGHSTVDAKSSEYGAAIGSGDEASNGGGTINILNGSKVTAIGGTDAAGIGTGNECGSACDAINIIDSNVTAHGGDYAAAIGGGDDVSGGNITIDNSVVYADRDPFYYHEDDHDEQSPVHIHRNCDGAGIGGGEDGHGGNITIKNHSDVTAYGGPYAAGIGGGDNGDGGNITITDSTVKAYGGTDAAGIGGGEDGEGGHILISDSNVYAEGNSYGAGIGAGEDGDGQSCEIYGNSTVEAVAGSDGWGISIGYGDYPLLAGYSTGTLYLERTLLVKTNSNKVYSGHDRYNAVWDNKTVKIYPCEHSEADTEWRYINEANPYHLKYCNICGASLGVVEEHVWDENNVCSVCHASAAMFTTTYVEQNNSGEVKKEICAPQLTEYAAPECTNTPDGYEFVCWSYLGSTFFEPGDVRSVAYSDITVNAVYFPTVEATYIDARGTKQTVKARQIHDIDHKLYLSEGWYIVDSDLNLDGNIQYRGDVRLIIADGKTLSFTSYSVEQQDQTRNAFWTMDEDNKPSKVTIYGQTLQTGVLDVGARTPYFYDLELNGSSVKATDTNYPGKGNIMVYNTCVVNRGKLAADRMFCGHIDINGGNVDISNTHSINESQLGWSELSDRICINYYDYGYHLHVADGKSLKDDDGNIYTSTLTQAQIEALGGKILTPYIAHDYNAPEWVWSNDYTSAIAVFRCKDCDDTQQVNAKVTHADSGKNRTSIARCVFNGQEFTATETRQIIFDVTVSDCENGTVAANKQTAKKGDNIKLTVTPDEGYILKALYYSASNGERYNIESCSFTMPESDVTVTAVFTPVRDIDYIDENGEIKSAQTIPLTGEETELYSGWYYVEGSVSAHDNISLSGSVKLILCDGAALDMGYNSLGEKSDGSDTALTVYRSPGDNIGRLDGFCAYAGKINHIGGQIELKLMIEADILNINGGSLSAKRMDINTSFDLIKGEVDINNDNGWIVYCNGDFNISGGTFNARSDDGETINCSGNLTVSGGKVNIDGEISSCHDGTAVTISGGTVNVNRLIKNGTVVSTKALSAEDIVISGGNTQIKGELFAYGDVTLGWTKLSDSIMVYDYKSAASLEIADGQKMTDGENVYSGSLDLSEIRWQLSGETLTPYTGNAWQTLQYKIDHAESNDTIMLNGNVEATAKDTALIIPAGKEITLDLNGYTLDRNLSAAAEDGRVIVNNGILTIKDSSAAQTGTVTGGYYNGDGGAILNNKTRTLKIEGGIFTGNTGNHGGVVYNMGTLNMTGGSMHGNTANGNGGAVWNGRQGVLNLSGGVITDNTYGEGGAVYSRQDGTLNIFGSPIVTENGDRNIYLRQAVINVTGALNADAKLAVTCEDVTDGFVFTSGLSGNGTAENFVSDQSDYHVCLNDDGEAVLKKVHIITLDPAENGSVEASESFACEGDTVALTVDPDEGYSVTSVTVNGAEITPEDGVYSFVMPDEDVTVSAAFGFADGIGARLVGHSISLDGDIGVNFYMELSDSIASSDTAYMRFTIPAGSITTEQNVFVKDARRQVVSGNKTYYVFKCQVAAKEMTSQIKAQIIDGELSGTEYTYSVKEYADYLLAHTDEREDLAKAAPLVRAMLNYGAYSQLYFDKNPDTLANCDLNDTEKALGDVQIDVADPVINNLPEGMTFEGATLSLKSETTLSLYFGSSEALTFNCEGYTVETVKSGNYQVARIRGIKAKHIGSSFTLSVNGGTITYSPLNYCRNVLAEAGATPDEAQNQQDEKLQNVVKALYLYWQAAQACFPE